MCISQHLSFCDLLANFSIAPTQLAPSGWRIMAGFVVLHHYAGMPLSEVTKRAVEHILEGMDRMLNNQEM